MPAEQYVCLVCGFNMIGFHPANCRFCGAGSKHFLTGRIFGMEKEIRRGAGLQRVLKPDVASHVAT